MMMMICWHLKLQNMVQERTSNLQNWTFFTWNQWRNYH